MSNHLRVEFLRRKHYPHPDGPVRMPGEVLPIRGDLAHAWAENGVVRLLDADSAPAAKAYDSARTLTGTSIVQLAETVATVTDVAVLEAALETDNRKTAKPIYQERLASLKEG